MPPIQPQVPHRPGPLHQTNKEHKGGRHNKKSSARLEIKTKTIAKPAADLRRSERNNQALQNRKIKRDQAIEEKRKLGSDCQPPLVIGLLDLYSNTSKTFIEGFKDLVGEDVISIKEINDREFYITSKRLRMRYKFVLLNACQFDESLDIVKTIDLMILVHRPQNLEDCDDFTESRLLRAIKIHCQPTLIHILDGSAETDESKRVKRIINAKRILKPRIEDEKMHAIEKSQDYLQLFHIISNCKRQKSLFKGARSTIITDKAEVIDNSLTLTGFVRNKTLSPNDLIHLIDWGDFQIKQIDILPDIVPLRPQSIEGSQIVETLVPDAMKQETLEEENDIDPMEGEQTWPTAEELATEAERKNTKRIVKKLPPGTSEYQGAWIPEESDVDDDSCSDEEDDEGDANMKENPSDEENDDESQASPDEDESQTQEEATMDVENYDKSYANEKELKILEKLKESRMEEMFPDEIDTPLDTPARMRFARYRGLKSFRTSAWDPQENLPPDYCRIFQFANFQQTKRRVINEESREGADPGQYVRIHLANVPQDIIQAILSKPMAPNMIALLKYEKKMTVMNLLIKRVIESNSRHPIKSKDELTFYVGFRKFKARPLFTTHSVSSKFKYERFLRDDVAMVATVYAPITFPPAPVLVFRGRELVASGSVMDSNPNRLVIKRVRLSGHPFKIHSKSAVVRFMFFNSEDVMYFKPVELVTKYNRRGHISEPLGTHGHMKCTFDKKIRSDDCIFMNLYKRVFPKWTYTPITGTSR